MIWLIAIGALLWILGWVAMIAVYLHLERLRDQQEPLLQLAEIRTETAELAGRQRVLRDDVAAARSEREKAEGEAAAARQAAAAIKAELNELRAEKKRQVGRVAAMKEEANLAERRTAEAAAKADVHTAELDDAKRRIAELQDEQRQLSINLGQLTAAVAKEKQHADELRRSREKAVADGAGRVEAMTAELARLEAALNQKQQTLDEFNRAVTEAESRLSRYQR